MKSSYLILTNSFLLDRCKNL